MKKLIQKIGKQRTILLITLIAIILAIIMDVLIAKLLGHEIIYSQTVLRTSAIVLILLPLFTSKLIDIAQDVDELEKSVNNLATYDELTGLFNRRVYLKACEKTNNYSKRNNQVYAVMSISIDNFKSINEKFGIKGGDRVLTVFSDLCKEIVRDSDIVARLGDKEFAFCLPNTNVEQATKLAERMFDKVLKKAVILGIKYIKYTISIGISINEHDNELTFEQALSLSEEAMQTANDNGGNRLEIFNS